MADRMTEYDFLLVKQPIGNIYAIKIRADELIAISQSKERKPYNDTSNVQRRLNPTRVKNIAQFSEKQNAMFLAPIILSGSSKYFKIDFRAGKISIDEEKLCNEKEYLSIVDGQHRLAGINYAKTGKRFEILALLMFDTTPSEDAQIFVDINKNQKPVTKSLVYDLFGLSDDRSVEHFAHEIVVNINSEDHSQMKNHIKMLGYKYDELENPSVTQGALVDQIIALISKNIGDDNERLKKDLLLESIDELPFRTFLIKYDIQKASEWIIDYLNAWQDLVVFLGYEKTLFIKSVGYNLAFRLFGGLLRDAQAYSNSKFEKYNEIVMRYIEDTTNKTENIFDNHRTKELIMDENLEKIERENLQVDRISGREKQFLKYLLCKLNKSQSFSIEVVNRFESNLKGVREIENIINNVD